MSKLKTSDRFIILLTIAGTFVIVNIMIFMIHQDSLVLFPNSSSSDFGDQNNKIVIGTVSCRKGNNTKPNEEALVMIKSALISAKLYHIKKLDFHIFLEYKEDTNFFINSVKAFKLDASIKISLHFHSALAMVPTEYHDAMIYKPRFRCTFARLFFPSNLPEIDAILYVDTDFIFTGNIATLWHYLAKMNNEQLIGAVANNAPGFDDPKDNLLNCFSGIPFVQPKGLNAGLMLMNLTKMRIYKWEEHMLKIYSDYSHRHKLEDQKLLNIMLYLDPGLLHLIPCQFGIRCSPCDHGFICKDAENDFYGIQALHGSNQQFEKGGRFHYIYQIYNQFNLAKDDIMEKLILPIRNYAEETSMNKSVVKCCKPINPLMFKNMF